MDTVDVPIHPKPFNNGCQEATLQVLVHQTLFNHIHQEQRICFNNSLPKVFWSIIVTHLIWTKSITRTIFCTSYIYIRQQSFSPLLCLCSHIQRLCLPCFIPCYCLYIYNLALLFIYVKYCYYETVLLIPISIMKLEVDARQWRLCSLEQIMLSYEVIDR